MSHSLPSRILNIVNLTEPQIDYEATKFYYNYFLKDESDPRESTSTISNIVTNSDLANVEPRFIKVCFDATDYSTNVKVTDAGFPNSQLGTSLPEAPATDGNLLKKIFDLVKNEDIRLDTIIVEGGMSNFYFSGFDLLDTQSDETLSDILNSAALVTDETFDNDKESPQSIAEKYKNRILNAETDSASVIDTDLILDFISDLSKQSVDLPSVTGEILTGRYQSISCGLNNFFIDEIVKASLDDTCHVFADEIQAISLLSENIKNNAYNILDNSNNGPITDADYTNFLRAGVVQEYEVFDHNDPAVFYGSEDTQNNPFEQKSSILRIGHIIEKIEYFGDQVKVYDPVVLSNTSYTYYDIDVRYGATYVYRIRNLYGVCYTFFNNITQDPGLCQFYRGVFAIASKSNEVKVECVDRERPEPPNSLHFNLIKDYVADFNTPLRISWEFPPNKKRDIKGFQLFRRESESLPYTLLAEFDFNDSNTLPELLEKAPEGDFYRYLDEDGETVVFKTFNDKDFRVNKEYIYALSSVDAHGQTSNLSVQIKVKFNSFTEKLEIKSLSPPGAPKAYPNIFINKDLFEDKMLINGKKRMTVYFNPDHYDIYSIDSDDASLKLYKNLLSISKNDEDPRYRISMTNTDIQKSNFLDIVIRDRSTIPVTLSSTFLDENNLSFSFTDFTELPDEES